MQLIGCCFNRTISTKVNHLQKELQKANIPQSNNQDKVQKLNDLDSQAWLYIEILNQLVRKNPESQVRVSETIEALKHHRLNFKKELEPLKAQEYPLLSKIQEFLQFITLTSTEKDLIKIENIINKITSYTSSSQPSETIIQDVITRLSSEAFENVNTISPKRIGLVYRLEELLTLIRQKEISQLNESELNKLNKEKIRELESERNIYYRAFKQLLEEKNIKDQKLEKYSQERVRLDQIIAEHQSEINNLNIELERYQAENENLNNKNEKFIQKLEERERQLRDLEFQREAYDRKINKLKKDIEQKNREISLLNNKLNKYSGINPLKGNYIGNLSNKKSKYHFHPKCQNWKNLALEYIWMPDDSRNVVSSTTATIFEENGLEPCADCSKKPK